MLVNRALPVARRILSLQRRVASPACVRLYHQKDDHCKDYVYPTMDDMPVPSGDWKTFYDSNVRKYNMELIAGIVLFTATVIVGLQSGLFWCSAQYPDKPAPRTVREEQN